MQGSPEHVNDIKLYKDNSQTRLKKGEINMRKRRLPLNLQFFSAEESADNTENKPESNTEEQPTNKKVEDDKEEKLYTEEELNEVLKARLARETKKREEAIAEAEKLAKMNADEKQKYELEKLQEENERLKAEHNKWSLGKEASAMLSEHNIVATDDILNFVVGNDAEQTSERVKSFAALVESVSNSIVQEKLKGNAPTRSASSTAHTRESIMDVKDSTERIRLIQQHPELFK